MSTEVAALRLAVIGCGPIGQRHARAVAGAPDARLIALCEIDPTRRAAAAQAFGVYGYECVEQLLQAEPVDAVIIATPDHLHVEPALIALRAGRHVFCEKPLATQLADAECLVRVAGERGVWLAVNYNRRFAFGYRTAWELLRQGRVGSLRQITVRVFDPVPPPRVTREPLVILTTLLTHHLDLLRYYGGEIQSLRAFPGHEPIGPLLRDLTISCDLNAGIQGHIEAGYRDTLTHTDEWLELTGDSGRIVVEAITRRVLLIPHGDAAVEEFLPAANEAEFYDSLTAHVREFIARVARDEAPPVSGADGLIGLQLAAAARRSLESGGETTPINPASDH